MLRQQGIRWLAILSLLALLAVPTGASAAGPAAPGPEGRLTVLWNRLLEWVGGGLSWLSTTAADCDRGGMIDPNGSCVAVATPPTTTSTCDPSVMSDSIGGCAASASTAGGR